MTRPRESGEHECQRCQKRAATHRLHLSVTADPPMTPSADIPRPFGPQWSMDMACCRPCAAEMALTVVGETVGAQFAKEAN